MKVSTFSAGTLGIAGLVAAGLLSMPGASTATAGGVDDRFAKRDDDTTEVVLVADDDDDDTNAKDNTNSRTKNTRSRGNNTNSRSRNDNTGTGAKTGRDDSRDRAGKDWTTDGPRDRVRDFSANQTNDRSRNNTRR